MPPTGPLLSKLDKMLDNLNKSVGPWQSNYLQQKGKYWQGIKTPPTTPADGDEIPPLIWLKPTDQEEDWTPVNLPGTVPLSGSVTTHNGPLGKGYTIEAWVMITGDGLYRKRIGFGPYSITDAEWIKWVAPD